MDDGDKVQLARVEERMITQQANYESTLERLANRLRSATQRTRWIVGTVTVASVLIMAVLGLLILWPERRNRHRQRPASGDAALRRRGRGRGGRDSRRVHPERRTVRPTGSHKYRRRSQHSLPADFALRGFVDGIGVYQPGEPALCPNHFCPCGVTSGIYRL